MNTYSGTVYECLSITNQANSSSALRPYRIARLKLHQPFFVIRRGRAASAGGSVNILTFNLICSGIRSAW